MKKFLALYGLLGVGLGAFGSHALKGKLSPSDLDIWKTATLYLFVHVLAGLFVFIDKPRSKAPLFFLMGCTLFSGSLYLLVLTQIRVLGAVTPVGGVAFMVGWGFYFKDCLKS